MEKYLPEKSQVILKCDMSAWQKVYYQQVTSIGRVDTGMLYICIAWEFHLFFYSTLRHCVAVQTMSTSFKMLSKFLYYLNSYIPSYDAICFGLNIFVVLLNLFTFFAYCVF